MPETFSTVREIFASIISGLHHLECFGLFHADLSADCVALSSSPLRVLIGRSDALVPLSEWASLAWEGKRAYLAPEILQLRSCEGCEGLVGIGCADFDHDAHEAALARLPKANVFSAG